MGFLPFVLKASPIFFGFLWASLQDCLPTSLLVARPLPLLKVCLLHHSPSLDKIPCLVSPLSEFLSSPMDKDWRLPVPIPMACIKWPQPYACLFCVKCHSSKALPQKKPWQKPQNRPPFLSTTKPHPLNPLIDGQSPLYWLGKSRWCYSPCVSSTILYICLPSHSCHSCLVSFCYVC